MESLLKKTKSVIGHEHVSQALRIVKTWTIGNRLGLNTNRMELLQTGWNYVRGQNIGWRLNWRHRGKKEEDVSEGTHAINLFEVNRA